MTSYIQKYTGFKINVLPFKCHEAVGAEMDIILKWHKMNQESANWCRVLYSYVDKSDQDILYIGKADRCSVRQRMYGEHKRGIFEHFNTNRIKSHYVIVGDFYLDEGKRLSKELIDDVESLLIKRLKPIANIQCLKSRIERPGMKVFCEGVWPHSRTAFHDK
jgi:hypothetical protein